MLPLPLPLPLPLTLTLTLPLRLPLPLILTLTRWYAKLFYQYENLEGGPSEIEVYYQDAGADAAIDGSYTNQAVSWLKQANRVRDLILVGKAEAAARYARRNVLVMLTITMMIAVLSGYVLQTMTFADPWHVLTYRSHAHEKVARAPTPAPTPSLTLTLTLTLTLSLTLTFTRGTPSSSYPT